MSKPIVLTDDHPIIKSLKFKPFRSNAHRRVQQFTPSPNEPQSVDLQTPWGAILTAQHGDYIVGEMDKPEDQWPVEKDIFEDTYEIIEPGICVKKAITLLVPLEDVADGDPDALVTVVSIEGPETVRAGDFYLAKGVKGEIWAYPRQKANTTLLQVA